MRIRHQDVEPPVVIHIKKANAPSKQSRILAETAGIGVVFKRRIPQRSLPFHPELASPTQDANARPQDWDYVQWLLQTPLVRESNLFCCAYN